jgi:biotin-(acetyl-CoA carboxylase) ligase
MTLGRQVVARRGEEMLVGLAEGVDESGALLIRTDDGTLRRVDAADVTLRDIDH